MAEQAYSFTEKKRIRRGFGCLPDFEVPNLLQIQRHSYDDMFLQKGLPSDKMAQIGLQGAFNAVFPIVSYSGNATLEYVGYRLGAPAFSVKECQVRGLSYAAPLRVK